MPPRLLPRDTSMYFHRAKGKNRNRAARRNGRPSRTLPFCTSSSDLLSIGLGAGEKRPVGGTEITVCPAPEHAENRKSTQGPELVKDGPKSQDGYTLRCVDTSPYCTCEVERP